MGAIVHLQHLQRLRLSGTTFDGEGLEALRRLQALSWLVLDNCPGVMSTWELAEAVAQVGSRSLGWIPLPGVSALCHWPRHMQCGPCV